MTTETCAMAEASESCGTYVSTQSSAVPGCSLAKGTIANGGGCAFNTQCTSEFCEVSDTSLCGVCAPPPVTGDDCTARRYCGQSGLRCVVDPLTSLAECQNVLADGATCAFSNQCGLQSFCANANEAKGVTGTCTPLSTIPGSACDTALNKSCDPIWAGLTCDSVSKTCQPVPVATAGQACGTNKVTHEYTACTGGSSCLGTLCVAIVKDGEACDSLVGPLCESPAVCVSNASGSGGASGASGGATMPGVCMLRTGVCN
jgi:hypothetical protein